MTIYLPDTPVADYPRADPVLVSGRHRVYLRDFDTGEELSDHPLSGAHWSGTGPMVSLRGQYVDGTARGVDVVAFLGGRWVEVRITADSFPGRRVEAKVWHPSEIDRRLLAKGDDSHVPARSRRLTIAALAA